MQIRRLVDSAAGAIIATAILAGGAAYAATGGVDDHPHGDTPATDDRVARENGATTSSTSSTSTTVVTVPAPAVPAPSTTAAPAVDDNPKSVPDDNPHSSSSTSTSTSTTVPRSTSTTSPSTTVVTAAVVRTVSSEGGDVTVEIRGTQVTLVAATPRAGYSVDVRKSGPLKVEVRFVRDRLESRVEVDAEHGAVRQRVENR